MVLVDELEFVKPYRCCQQRNEVSARTETVRGQRFKNVSDISLYKRDDVLQKEIRKTKKMRNYR